MFPPELWASHILPYALASLDDACSLRLTCRLFYRISCECASVRTPFMRRLKAERVATLRSGGVEACLAPAVEFFMELFPEAVREE